MCAGLTNQPLGDAKDPTKRCRGELPLALARHVSAAAAVDALLAAYRPCDFNGSWLLVGDRTSLYFVDFTEADADAGTAVALAPGIHVLENRALAAPSAKVDLVRETLGSPTGGDEIVAAFRRALTDHRMPEGEERPNAANCVHLESFGTRSSCLVRVRPERAGLAAGPSGRRSPVRHPLRGRDRAVGRAGRTALVASVPHERLVADPVRLIGVDAEPLAPWAS